MAAALGMTATAVRKHLDALEAAEMVMSHDRAPYGPMLADVKRRGRPARVFAITSKGREFFEQPYDEVALQAVRFIEQHLGDAGLKTFAHDRMSHVWSDVMKSEDTVTPEELAARLSDLGFSASIEAAPVEGVQLCQHNCPIAHVAGEYPQFCEAETEAISAALGVRVTRLSTIASGSQICTTHIPLSPTRRTA
jgi:predicted ArsR family transcriptional regulator